MIIKDIYTQEEKKALMRVIKKHKGETISVAKLATEAGLNPNRARFVMDILIHDGKVVKTPTKAFNKNYVRYEYSVVK